MKTIEQILADARLKALFEEVVNEDEAIEEDTEDLSKLITSDFAFAMNQNMEDIRNAGLDESFDYDSVLCDEEREEIEEYESELKELKTSIKRGENNLKEELAKPFHLQDKDYLRQVKVGLQLLKIEANDIEDNILLLKESARESSQ